LPVVATQFVAHTRSLPASPSGKVAEQDIGAFEDTDAALDGFFSMPQCRRFRLSPNLHHPPLHLHPCTSNPAYLHRYIQRYGIMMMELALALAVGFALGYGVREWVSRQRRRAFGRQRR
jgi:hypothetical protein